MIELLAVIAVIAILVALLLPTLCQTTRAGRVARCQGNVRQLMLGLALYVEDHGAFPLDGPATRDGKDYYKWHVALRAYTMAGWMQDLYRCPDYRGLTQEGGAGSCLAYGSYGYNIQGVEAGRRSSLGLGGGGPDWPPLVPNVESSVSHPVDMIALGDASLNRIGGASNDPGPRYLGNGSLSPPSGWNVPADSYRLTATRRRHSGRLNLAFCDGHLESVTAERVGGTTESTLRRWNRDNQPHLELVSLWRP